MRCFASLWLRLVLRELFLLRIAAVFAVAIVEMIAV
jgi:hypothetical protein